MGEAAERTTMTAKLRVLPFAERFERALLSGQKTMTARTKRYGNAGDLLETRVGLIRLLGVGRHTLRDIRDRYWREEGATSPSQFVTIWKMLHPRVGFDPDRMVWLHRFELVSNE